MRTGMIAALALVFVFGAVSYVGAHVFCGFHDNAFPMTAYHWNSEFWVNMLTAEAGKWNNVHGTLRIGRTRRNTVHVGEDGRSVVSWISESDLQDAYGLSWLGTVGWAIRWYSGADCTRVDEADVFFNPGITQFTPQTQVPYSLGYQEIVLHELGHVLTQEHEDRTLAVMTAGAAVSDVLYASDKVGWLRSADFRFDVTDRQDMGVFPLRNNGANKIYSTLSSTTGTAGDDITIRDFTVQNLSSALETNDPSFQVFLENTATGDRTQVGWFSWTNFCAYCEWDGSLTYRVPAGVTSGSYRVVAEYDGSDADATNNRAVFGILNVS